MSTSDKARGCNQIQELVMSAQVNTTDLTGYTIYTAPPNSEGTPITYHGFQHMTLSNLADLYVIVTTSGSKGRGRGAMAPPSKGLTKMKKMAQFAASCIIEKKFPRGHAPRPPNSLIYSIFLAHAAAGPLQCKSLEPSVEGLHCRIVSIWHLFEDKQTSKSHEKSAQYANHM